MSWTEPLSRNAVATDLLSRPLACCLASVGRTGEPYTVVVWCTLDSGDVISVNARRGRWLDNLKHRPAVAVTVVDDNNSLRYVSVQGRVVAIEKDVAYRHINALSLSYEGRLYAYSAPDQVDRFKVTIKPVAVRVVDHAPPPRAPAG